VLAHRSLVCSFLLMLLLLLSQVLGSWGFLVKPAEAASMGVRPSAPANMTFQQYLKEGQQSKAYHGPVIPPVRKQTATGPSTNYANLPPSAEPATMQPITQALSPAFLSGSAGASAFDLKGSDGRLEVLVPPGALDVFPGLGPIRHLLPAGLHRRFAAILDGWQWRPARLPVGRQ